jgi:hypothetical protein
MAETSQSESRPAKLLRNPLVVGLALLTAIATAFQVAGVTTMLLAKIILAGGVWILIVVEVWCSKWIRTTGLYAHSIVLLTCTLSGFGAVSLGALINNLKQQQIAMTISPVVDGGHHESPPTSAPAPPPQPKPSARLAITRFEAVPLTHSAEPYPFVNLHLGNQNDTPALGFLYEAGAQNEMQELTPIDINSRLRDAAARVTKNLSVLDQSQVETYKDTKDRIISVPSHAGAGADMFTREWQNVVDHKTYVYLIAAIAYRDANTPSRRYHLLKVCAFFFGSWDTPHICADSTITGSADELLK